MKVFIGTIALLLVMSNSNYLSAQDFGFLGKKNTFSISGTGAFRVFPSLIGYVGFSYDGGEQGKLVKYDQNNQVSERSKIGRVDIRASYMRLLNPKISLGLEFGYEKFNLPLGYYTEFNYSGTGYLVQPSTPVFNAYSYMIVLEMHARGNSAPAGFSTALGLGPKIFAFDYDQNYRYNSTEEMTNPYPVGATDIIAINFFFQVNYRMALTDFLAFDIGTRIHTGFVLPPNPMALSQSYTSTYSKDNLRTELFTENLASLISLKLGLSFLF